MARYILQKAQQVPDGWVCTDTENGIVCRWQAHRFNETQQVTALRDEPKPDAMRIAHQMREMADWLSENHRDRVF
jgi:hypothetical protein